MSASTQHDLFPRGRTVVKGFAPDSTWSPPNLADLPNHLHGTIGIDLETRDNDLTERGPGWCRRDGGYVVGYSIAADEFEVYLPIRHEGGGNLDPDHVHLWLNDVLADASQPKVGANSILYDAGWAETDGVRIAGTLYDVQWAEALLNEQRKTYNLDFLGRLYLNRGKNDILLHEAAEAFGVHPGSEMWRLPSSFVGAYGTEDGVLARDVFAAQLPYLRDQGLMELLELETALGPLYRRIRRRGIRVDFDRAEQLQTRWRKERDELLAEIKRRTGFAIDPWVPTSVAKALDAEGITYGRTPKTKAPSITKGFLENHPSWLCKTIRAVRERDRLAGTFIDSALLSHATDGRLHPEIHPLRGDWAEKKQGTVTGRLSMSNPNPQQFPARTTEGLMMRECLIPEEGELWGSGDYSQQEPRLLVHFASKVRRNGEPLPGAIEARDAWRADPDLSYHKMTAEISGLEYFPAKTLNLARIYGRGARTTADELGRSIDEVKRMFARHHAAMPYVQAMAELCMTTVRRREPTGRDRYARGRVHPPAAYISSLLGRRSRFMLYEPDRFGEAARGRGQAEFEAAVKRANAAITEALDNGELEAAIETPGGAFPFFAAEKAYPNERLGLARLHKALNALIQPSAADQTKKAMLDADRAGLGDYLRLQVHDELNGSFPSEREAERLAECMRDAIPLEVPVKVDLKTGPTWGACK